MWGCFVASVLLTFGRWHSCRGSKGGMWRTVTMSRVLEKGAGLGWYPSSIGDGCLAEGMRMVGLHYVRACLPNVSWFEQHGSLMYELLVHYAPSPKIQGNKTQSVPCRPTNVFAPLSRLCRCITNKSSESYRLPCSSFPHAKTKRQANRETQKEEIQHADLLLCLLLGRRP